MTADAGLEALKEDETEAEYVDRKTKEYLVRRERSLFRPHFNYRRSR